MWCTLHSRVLGSVKCLQKLILFSLRNALNWSKMTWNTFITSQKIHTKSMVLFWIVYSSKNPEKMKCITVSTKTSQKLLTTQHQLHRAKVICLIGCVDSVNRRQIHKKQGKKIHTPNEMQSSRFYSWRFTWRRQQKLKCKRFSPGWTIFSSVTFM